MPPKSAGKTLSSKDVELLTETMLETVLATAAGMEPAVMIMSSARDW